MLVTRLSVPIRREVIPPSLLCKGVLVGRPCVVWSRVERLQVRFYMLSMAWALFCPRAGSAASRHRSVPLRDVPMVGLLPRGSARRLTMYKEAEVASNDSGFLGQG